MEESKKSMLITKTKSQINLLSKVIEVIPTVNKEKKVETAEKEVKLIKTKKLATPMSKHLNWEDKIKLKVGFSKFLTMHLKLSMKKKKKKVANRM